MDIVIKLFAWILVIGLGASVLLGLIVIYTMAFVNLREYIEERRGE